MANRSMVGTGLSLLGGLGLGAGLMYLMDPQLGRYRRSYLQGAVGGALQGTTERLGSGWQSTTERMGETAREFGQRIARRARSMAGQEAEYIGVRRIRYGPVILSSLGALGVGAALVYFLDPEHGRRRRMAIRDRVMYATGRAAQSVRDTSRQLRDRMRGMAEQVREQASEG